MAMPETKSLSEVYESVDPAARKSKWRRIAAFFGPAYLVSVGYMDPGNWATDLAGGSQFGYKLLWVLVMSNIMALLLQSLSVRLGIVRGRDLAQCNRETYPKGLNFILYILAELGIAATDLAEVLGMAIGLHLLLDIPILIGVGITLLDTLLLLWLQRLGMRKMEAFIIALVGIIGLCFLVEIMLAQPPVAEIVKGLSPSIPNSAALYISIGIIGATVMPHNLYLHSALVQTRKVGRDEASLRKAIKLNTIDSAVALNLALFVNASILILAAATFHKQGMAEVSRLEDAHLLLGDLLGSEWASHLFAIALIAAGQSSTVTGTLAGQIVMEGYLRLRINPWMRRLLTRLVAIVPAVIVILILGDEMVDEMLIFSQVILSMQLAFAIIPLIHFVSDRQKMGVFRIKRWMEISAWTITAVIVILNLQLVLDAVLEVYHSSGHVLLKMLVVAGGFGLVLLLLIVTFYPWHKKKRIQHAVMHPEQLDFEAAVQPFHTIALALDYSSKDASVLQYGLKLADAQTRFLLIHIVESAQARMRGNQSMDAETMEDRMRLEAYAVYLESKGFEVLPLLGFSGRTSEIARMVKEQKADLLVVGSHGHRGFKDWLFGETINQVRHRVDIPVFIAK